MKTAVLKVRMRFDERVQEIKLTNVRWFKSKEEITAKADGCKVTIMIGNGSVNFPEYVYLDYGSRGALELRSSEHHIMFVGE